MSQNNAAGPPAPPPATAELEAAPLGSPTPEVLEVRRGAFGAHGAGDTTGFGGLTRLVQLPGSSPRPYGGWFDAAVEALAEDLAGAGLDQAIEKVVVDRGELTVFLRREDLLAAARFLRDDQDLRFELSLGVSGVHYPGDRGRELHAVYHLMSVTHGRRLIRLEVAAPDSDPRIPSLVEIYPTQDWHERETYDMFGIRFEGHPALARILMPNDWVGHPQRKDYPLGGVDVQFKGASVPPPDLRRNYS
ncbi:MAG: NADH-quinone oxidoreductase subunit C [Bifidobacteriaceae bacterium]|jgi:NADH-quinone oxidoreductase subunit C|nr:NADH-quinone oxidoreductase subunit C [Bifidobacteriaceae bacterium]